MKTTSITDTIWYAGRYAKNATEERFGVEAAETGRAVFVSATMLSIFAIFGGCLSDITINIPQFLIKATQIPITIWIFVAIPLFFVGGIAARFLFIGAWLVFCFLRELSRSSSKGLA